MKRIQAGVFAAAIFTWGAAAAQADERHFTYSYEAQTLPKGGMEIEQWATARLGKEDGTFHRIQMREEFEYGITDRLTTALYFNWEYLHVQGVTALPSETETEFETVSSEWKYKLLDPSVDPIGLLAYAEIGAGSDEQELELKVVAQKNFGEFRLVYNLVVEFEREEETEPNGEKEWEKESALMHTAGVSYQVSPNLAIGFEGYHVQHFEGIFKEQEGQALFVGPNLHAAFSRVWATLTCLAQVDYRGAGHDLELDLHEQYEVRLIFGVSF
jgi:opacity protein-like surface antigen